MRTCGNTLKNFPSIPFPKKIDLYSSGNSLINEELDYDKEALAKELSTLVGKLTNEHKELYDTIIGSVDNDVGGVFFLYGQGGTGKTFIWKTLYVALRSREKIVLNVATSGITSLLLPGGRTAHSRLHLPFNPTSESFCKILAGTPEASLVIQVSLIIWDEAPMMHKLLFEALDRTLKDILKVIDHVNEERPFGGKTIVFGGDFRQILPVIPRGSRQEIVNSTINSSTTWNDCCVSRLTKNMRLLNVATEEQSNELKEFAEWITSIGDGIAGGPNDEKVEIEIPEHLLVKESEDPIEAIVNSIYPLFAEKVGDYSFLEGRVILAPTLNVVDSINDYMISKIHGECRTYLSSDTLCRSDKNTYMLDQVHAPEFLNTIKCSGVPNHEIKLKVGIPIMLLRNVDHSLGLCNWTRLIITKLADHVVEAQFIVDVHAEDKVLILRMSLTSSDIRLSFKFQIKQFPLTPSYAMTINKSQGQSLSIVGFFLKKTVFSHVQLYVALSRVINREDLKILICDENENMNTSTTNVVHKEVFNNL